MTIGRYVISSNSSYNRGRCDSSSSHDNTNTSPNTPEYSATPESSEHSEQTNKADGQIKSEDAEINEESSNEGGKKESKSASQYDGLHANKAECQRSTWHKQILRYYITTSPLSTLLLQKTHQLHTNLTTTPTSAPYSTRNPVSPNRSMNSHVDLQATSADISTPKSSAVDLERLSAREVDEISSKHDGNGVVKDDSGVTKEDGEEEERRGQGRAREVEGQREVRDKAEVEVEEEDEVGRGEGANDDGVKKRVGEER